ncbi:uncharacterized protein LOC107045477 [Diachasma alloeum]|uniref:uncharacterized protein LOC107045477 n=1 Tax=Diachasma alloeum TaxID=454923 RepID=UPI000738395F|nr:uncharacterized protein LOC107045477 [Diachasma alloeum]XP_015123259.1 uncharacterized protein LOC107045477 [Diachasma alloeum]
MANEGHYKAFQRIKKLYDEARTPSMNKMEIHPGTEVFIHRRAMTEAMDDFNDTHNWKQLATNVFVEIYGDTLRLMSVKGTKGKIKMHTKIYKAVKEFVYA